jgi:hypothetical protein
LVEYAVTRISDPRTAKGALAVLVIESSRDEEWNLTQVMAAATKVIGRMIKLINYVCLRQERALSDRAHRLRQSARLHSIAGGTTDD